MDIEALLAESNLEATAEDSAYENDEFDDDGTDTLDSKDGTSNATDKMAILKAAAAKVALEEKRIADKVFNTTADSIQEDIKARNLSERDAESILAGASKVVNEHYNKIDGTDADKYKTIEEKSEDEDEGDDDEDEETEQDPELNQTLLFAVHEDKVENVKKILQKGAYYFSRDRHGWTPLHWAAAKGFVDVVEVLLDHVKKAGKSVGKYINSQDKLAGWTPMHVSAGIVDSRIFYLSGNMSMFALLNTCINFILCSYCFLSSHRLRV